MKKLKIALDWTPNVNHIGFLIAKELDFYHHEEIDLEILNPADDNYAITPGKKLELGIADLAIAPFETVISLNNKKNPIQVTAIYAVLQKDLSCVATLASSDITSPKQLDGKTYASYKARYEDQIVKEMVKNDGGHGQVNFVYPEKLGIWNSLLNGQADSTWIFDNWEGIEASSKGIELNKFALNEFEIPYGYSPVVVAKREDLASQKAFFSAFVKATKKGFLFAQSNLEESISILQRYVTRYDSANIDLAKSLAFTIPHFGDELTCGSIIKEKVSEFLKWLVDKGLEDHVILEQNLFTNELDY